MTATTSESTESSAAYMRYFIYSDEQFKIRKEIESKLGKVFKAGTVIVNGQQKEFTEITNNVDINRYSDAKIVMYGDIRTIKYSVPD